MSKMFLENQIPDGESTEDMVLVYNRTATPKTATSNGHTLGAREKAWVTWDDPILVKAIKEEFFRVIKKRYTKTDRVVVDGKPPHIQPIKVSEPEIQHSVATDMTSSETMINTRPNNQARKKKAKNKPQP